MRRYVRNAALGLLLGGVGACESPSFFREQEITLSPLEAGPLSAAPSRSGRIHSPTAARMATRQGVGRAARAQRGQEPKVMIFDVRDLLAVTPNFVAPEMDVFGSGGGPELPEPPLGQAFIDEGTLLDALRAALPSDLLSEDATMTITGGRLIVTNPSK